MDVKSWSAAILPVILIFVCCSVMQSGGSGDMKYTGYISVPGVFGDHMVLQRNRPISVWGTSAPHSRIVVRLEHQKETAYADDSGRWSLELQPMKAGGPYEMILIGKNILRFQDVYIGEVWICSGQSNMEWQVSQANDAENEIKNADYPKIRLLTVDRNISHQPLDDIHTQGWKICSPKTVGDFSAVGYFFGQTLRQYMDIPIGLIHASWGGTVAEAWTSKTGLQAFPEIYDTIKQPEDSSENMPSYQEQQQSYQEAQEDWLRTIDNFDEGLARNGLGWADPHLLADDWSVATLPGLWEGSEVGIYDGIVWYRKGVTVPDTLMNRSWKLNLGPIDDIDQTWINGTYLGGMDVYNQNRVYDIPENVLQSGINIIVVRVIDHHGGGGIWGRKDQLALTSEEGDEISLAGEWLWKIGVPRDKLPPVPQEVVGMENTPTVLFNAMIHPLVPLGLQGVIWYQGESNEARAYQYRSLFPALIRDWRDHWKQDFSFYFVQLANYRAIRPEPAESYWAELREAQMMTLNTPKTGMAVTIDIGEAEDIHPKNKQDVGKRLALNALAKDYHQDVVYSGPMYRSMIRENGKIRLMFDYCEGGLVAKGNKILKGFAIAGEDRQFVWADAVIDGESVLVSSPSVQKPAAVRYAWADNPVCNLYNGAGLPASPFRTDDWPGLTWPDSVK